MAVHYSCAARRKFRSSDCSRETLSHVRIMNDDASDASSDDSE